MTPTKSQIATSCIFSVLIFCRRPSIVANQIPRRNPSAAVTPNMRIGIFQILKRMGHMNFFSQQSHGEE